MKKIIFYSLFVGIFMACDNDDDNQPVGPANSNKIVLLQVDYLMNEFEAAKEIEFTQNSNFTISSTYKAPGDFGSVQLYYDEVKEKIFDGTIIWLGKGERSFPNTLSQANDFSTIDSPIAMPKESMFKKVMYNQTAFYPDTINYTDIWNSISDLEMVKSYRTSNPNSKINLFLYTPSVGIGNPAEWDWYVILKN